MVGKTESEKKEEYCIACNIWLAPYENKKHVGKHVYHPEECYKKRKRKRRNGNGNFNFFKFIKNGAKFANAPS